MEELTAIIETLAGVPAFLGLILTALTIFLTSDWRLSLTALLVQYILSGVALTGSLRIEIVLVKILVGVFVVSILYLTARRLQEHKEPLAPEQAGRRVLGMSVSWVAGPLGLPLRVLTVLLVGLAVLRVFSSYQLTIVSLEVAFAAVWLGAMGVAGLILSGDPLRVAPALLTILCGFDLVYARLEPSLAVVGFWGALMLLTALAFAYLATVQSLSATEVSSDSPPSSILLLDLEGDLDRQPKVQPEP